LVGKLDTGCVAASYNNPTPLKAMLLGTRLSWSLFSIHLTANGHQANTTRFWPPFEEINLLSILDELNERKVRFAISNLITHKGQENAIFADWAVKYDTTEITSNYIGYHDNSVKNSREVLVRNYD
jgi:hypothetical protein